MTDLKTDSPRRSERCPCCSKPATHSAWSRGWPERHIGDFCLDCARCVRDAGRRAPQGEQVARIARKGDA